MENVCCVCVCMLARSFSPSFTMFGPDTTPAYRKYARAALLCWSRRSGSVRESGTGTGTGTAHSPQIPKKLGESVAAGGIAVR